jgi:LacI family repressor for deo operon, udp, cdd, tsx, nupC, and nupG
MTIDNVAGAAIGTRHLVELGHRRIALMAGPGKRGSRSTVPRQRTEGFELALAAGGLDRDSSLVIDGGFTTAGGAEAMCRLLDRSDPPSAVFCMSDEMAMGALGAARTRGVRIPEDMSVVGFDGHDLAPAFGLTTVGQPVREMGRRATERLLDTIMRTGVADTHDTAEVSLDVRSSTAPPA